MVPCEIGGDGGAEGAAKDDDSIRGDFALVDELVPCGLSVEIGSLLSGFSVALAIAAVIEDEDVEA